MSVSFLEHISMASRTLNSNRLRSGLTMLGMIIGNASVIVMVALGQAAQQFVNQEFESLGSNILFVTPSVESRGPQGGAFQSNSLTLADAEAIVQAVPDAIEVAPEKSKRFQVTWGDRDTQVNITGTTPAYLTTRNVEVAFGEFLGIVHIRSNDRVAVLGSETAKSLFGNRDPIGEKIRIQSQSFQVIGTMSERGSTFGQNQDEVVFIPISTMSNQLTGQDSLRSSPSVQSISVTALAGRSSAAQYQITNLIRLRHDILRGDDDFTVRSQQDLLQSANNITNILVLVLGATAGISLLVGGIGIANIMLVSVTERTREIGLRKAIGATGWDILAQFSVEAVILSTIGGIVGICLGLVGILAIALLSSLEAIFSTTAIVVAVSVSSGIGLVFGAVPARNAANLDPVIALRS